MNNKRRGHGMPWRVCAGVFLLLGASALALAESASAQIATYPVINEIQIDGLVGTGGTNDDWVELYNPTDSPVSLDGWSLQKHAQASSSSISKVELSGTIAAQGYFLVMQSAARADLLALADLTAAGLSLAPNNTVYLVNDNVRIENRYDENIVDYVGFGSAEIFEGAAAAPNPGEEKSIARVIAGQDSNDNFNDFVELEIPTPQNSASGGEGGESGGDDDGLSGSVELTVLLAAIPVVNIGSTAADIVFQVNGASIAFVKYGLDSAYGSVSPEQALSAGEGLTISLSGLECGTDYHYSVNVRNQENTENDFSENAVFSTLSCGIAIDSLIMTKTAAKANDKFTDGWAWEFDVTIWDLAETNLKMKFQAWNGSMTLDAGANMRFSVDNANWIDISANNEYPLSAIDVSGVDTDVNSAGRQVKIYVEMKVPAGTPVGVYNSAYAILVE